MGCVHGFDNSIFGEEACQEGRTSEGQAPDCEACRCEGGKVVHASYFSNVLFIIKAVNNRPGAKEEYCLEECMGANMEKC